MMEVQTLNGENITVSETAPDQGYYDQPKPGNHRSLYGDMIRSRDFGEQALYPTHQLYELGGYWKDQLTNPERSPRARIEIGKLVTRTSFEITMRQRDHIALSQRQLEEDQMWDEYMQELAAE